MNRSNTHVLVHLNLIAGVSAHTIVRLLADVTGEMDEVDRVRSLASYDLTVLYEWTMEQWRCTSLSSRMQALIYNGLRDQMKLARELELCEHSNVRVIAFGDDEYPTSLYHITAPPPVLYVKGNDLSAYDRTVAIVGSRRANAYGKRVTQDLVTSLVNHDVAIVSGGAYGIDICAHRGAYDNGGETVVVLGSGLGFPYPREHAKWFDAIADDRGTLVSPFSFEAMPRPGCFPARNRIISGLSDVCIVVQAAQKSGALITAQYARDQGKDVYVVPGSIYDPLSRGCHEHILDGAHIVVDIEYAVSQMFEVETGVGVDQEHKQGNGEIIALDDHPIMVVLTGRTLSFDELHAQLEGTASELHDALFTLQLHGKVRQDFTGCWYRC